MKIIILTVQWDVGLFLLMGSMGGLLQGDFILASLCFLVGLVLLPPVSDRFRKPKDDKQPHGSNDIVREIENKYLRAIEQGETAILEFKSTLRVDLKTGKAEKFIQHAVIKTIAAFLNSKGGVLLIGVNDQKEIIGLDADFNSFQGNDKLDEFQKFFDTLLANSIGNRFQRYLQIEFPVVSNKIICAVMVSAKSSAPVYVPIDNKQEAFYIRRLASTIDLLPSESHAYIREHWKK